MFPLPTFLFLAGVKFYLLHTRNKLHHITLVCRCLLKPFVIELPAFFKEKHYPSDIEYATGKKDKQYAHVIPGHDYRVNNKCNYGKHNVYQRACEERLYAVMVAYSLHYITYQLYIEEGYGELHQFYQEIGD